MNKVKVTISDGEEAYFVGKFEPKEVQPVVDLFLAHDWLNPDGDAARVTKAYLLVHDFTSFQVELS